MAPDQQSPGIGEQPEIDDQLFYEELDGSDSPLDDSLFDAINPTYLVIEDEAIARYEPESAASASRLRRFLDLLAPSSIPTAYWAGLVSVLVLLLLAGGYLVLHESDDGETTGETTGEVAGEVAGAEEAAEVAADVAEAEAGQPAAPEPVVGDAVTEPAGEVSGPAANDLVASAAGVYRLQEESVRVPLEANPTVERFVSADGTIVVESDGAVSGEFIYVYWAPPGDETPRARVTADNTLDPAGFASVVAGDEGLTFESNIVVFFLIEPDGKASYTNPGTDYTVTAFVDPENGFIELTPTGAGESSFDFLR